MFRNTIPAADPPHVVVEHDDLIPLSVLRLELDPGERGWPVFLGQRGIAYVPDRIGRDSITPGDAQRLIHERREQELKGLAVLKAQEAAAVEADRAFRASLPRGVPWYALDGAGYAEAAAASELGALPKRTSPLEEALQNRGDELTFHSLREGEES
jgi:hypothetical protein